MHVGSWRRLPEPSRFGSFQCLPLTALTIYPSLLLLGRYHVTFVEHRLGVVADALLHRMIWTRLCKNQLSRSRGVCPAVLGIYMTRCSNQTPSKAPRPLSCLQFGPLRSNKQRWALGHCRGSGRRGGAEAPAFISDR